MKHKLFLAALALPASAQAHPLTDLAALDRAVEQFTGAEMGQPGGANQPVDRRLHLSHCDAPPALSWYGTGRDTVLIRCPDAGSWRIFVPLIAAASTPNSQPVVLRGEAVTIAVEGDDFSVAEAGEALDAGAVGSWIRVRGSNANAQTFRARVVRPGLVALDLGTTSAGRGLQ